MFGVTVWCMCSFVAIARCIHALLLCNLASSKAEIIYRHTEVDVTHFLLL